MLWRVKLINWRRLVLTILFIFPMVIFSVAFSISLYSIVSFNDPLISFFMFIFHAFVIICFMDILLKIFKKMGAISQSNVCLTWIHVLFLKCVLTSCQEILVWSVLQRFLFLQVNFVHNKLLTFLVFIWNILLSVLTKIHVVKVSITLRVRRTNRMCPIGIFWRLCSPYSLPLRSRIWLFSVCWN